MDCRPRNIESTGLSKLLRVGVNGVFCAFFIGDKFFQQRLHGFFGSAFNDLCGVAELAELEILVFKELPRCVM